MISAIVSGSAGVQEAIQQGRLKPADLSKWLRLSTIPLLGQLAQMSSGTSYVIVSGSATYCQAIIASSCIK